MQSVPRIHKRTKRAEELRVPIQRLRLTLDDPWIDPLKLPQQVVAGVSELLRRLTHPVNVRAHPARPSTSVSERRQPTVIPVASRIEEPRGPRCRVYKLRLEREVPFPRQNSCRGMLGRRVVAFWSATSTAGSGSRVGGAKELEADGAHAAVPVRLSDQPAPLARGVTG